MIIQVVFVDDEAYFRRIDVLNYLESSANLQGMTEATRQTLRDLRENFEKVGKTSKDSA